MTKKATTGNKRSKRLLRRRYIGYFAVFNGLLLLCASLFRAFDSGLFGGCFIKKLFHIYCPGCGGTRALSSMIRLDIMSSLRQNPLVLFLLSVVLYYDAINIGATITGREPSEKTKKLAAVLSYIFMISVIAYFVIRNTALIFFRIDPLSDIIR